MPTDEWFKANPKISGYTTPAIHDRLNQFAKERGVSVSQALTIALAEYFGMEQQVKQSSSVGGLSLVRFQELEQQVQDLKIQEIRSTLESLQATVNLLVDQSKLKAEDNISSQDHSLLTEISSTDSGSYLVDQDSSLQISLPEDEFLVDEQENDITSIQANEVEVTNSHIELLDRKVEDIQPLSGIELGQRLGANKSVITRYKDGKRKQSLAEWSKNGDPDGVGWEFSEKLKKYVPIQNITNVSTSNLQIELLVENKEPPIENQAPSPKLQTEQKVFDGTPFTGDELAARLSMNNKRSLDNRRSGKQAVSFSEWTQNKDPDKIAWRYVPEAKMYYPIEPTSKPKIEPIDLLAETPTLQSQTENQPSSEPEEEYEIVDRL